MMNFTQLNIDNNTSCYINEWNKILAAYGDKVTFDEVWTVAKQSEILPVIGNIYQSLVIDKIINHFCEELGIESDSSAVQFDVSINTVKTVFCINNIAVDSFHTYRLIVEKLEYELGDTSLLN